MVSGNEWTADGKIGGRGNKKVKAESAKPKRKIQKLQRGRETKAQRDKGKCRISNIECRRLLKEVRRQKTEKTVGRMSNVECRITNDGETETKQSMRHIRGTISTTGQKKGKRISNKELRMSK
jgi:hypothetical protein